MTKSPYAPSIYTTPAHTVRKGMIVKVEGGQSEVKARATNLFPGKITLLLTTVGIVHLDPYELVEVVAYT